MTDTTDAIALIPAPLTPLVVYQTKGGADDILEKIKHEVRSRVLDISTDAGRKEIRSLAYKVARTKTALDDMGKDLTEEQKRVIDAVNESRRKIRNDLDALKEEIMQPLLSWEAAEEKRMAAHDEAIARINVLCQVNWAETPLSEIETRIDEVKKYGERDWQEFVMRGTNAFETALQSLDKAAASRKAHDDQQAELERLRKEAAEREEMERARKETHTTALSEIKIIADIGWSEFTAQQIQEKIDQLEPYKARAWEEFKKEADATIDLAEKHLEDELDARVRYDEEQAELETRRAQDEENERIRKENEAAQAALVKAEQARSKAIADAEAAVAAATKAEADRQQKIRDEEKAAELKRSQDREHKAAINNEVLAAMNAVWDEAVAKDADALKALVVAIAQGLIPHTKISY